jgi:dynein heavy chain
MPVVVALRNKELKDYHWIEIKKIIGKDFAITEEFTLKNLLDMGVVDNVYEI